MKMQSLKKGMSLPELITVIVIIAIIGAAAISYVVSAVSEAQTNTKNSNASALAAFLNQAAALGADLSGVTSNTPMNSTSAGNLAGGLSLPAPSAVKVSFQGISIGAQTDGTYTPKFVNNVWSVTPDLSTSKRP